jgi:hypothetical protein
MSTLKRVGSFATLVLAGANALAGTDPFDGLWKCTGCRNDMTIVIRSDGESVEYDSEISYDNGRKSKTHYAARYDGSLAFVTGSTGMMLPVSLRRIDSHTVEATYIRGFQVVASSRRIVSESGDLMTITTTSKDSTGKVESSNVCVFVKQAASSRAQPHDAAAGAESHTAREVLHPQQTRGHREPAARPVSP